MRLALLSLAAATSLVAQDTPFNGKDLAGWQTKSKDGAQSGWTVGTPTLDPANPAVFTVQPGGSALVNAVTGHGKGLDAYTTAKWGDIRLELEVMVPKGSNSGIYVMGEYEVQVFDSFGNANPGPGDMGGIYGASAPKVNAATAPGTWQHYLIEFRAPRFDASGKKIADATFVKVVLNGKVIHENVTMKGPTPSGVTGREAPTGPIMFQGDHGPVAYRNIRISPLP